MFEPDDGMSVLEIGKASLEYARKHGNRVVIFDTAGRLHIDEDMMNELKEVKSNLNVTDTVLVVDAMTGQDAVNLAKAFNDELEIDGVILTKLDGDTRGGAALSIKAVTGKPILYSGMGEKLTDLEPFYPDRMASRILGMGDVLSLIEKAESNIDKEEAIKLSKKVKKADFDFNDYLLSMEQMKKMGGISSILGMIPGISGSQADKITESIDDKKLSHIKAIIESMTLEERSDPKLINSSRKIRISKGSGVSMAEVNRFIKQFNEAKKMMKKMPGMMKRKGRGGLRFPF
jgi:signal recognition particle subunit SRP54